MVAAEVIERGVAWYRGWDRVGFEIESLECAEEKLPIMEEKAELGLA